MKAVYKPTRIVIEGHFLIGIVEANEGNIGENMLEHGAFTGLSRFG
jgi:hypothetical protein